MQLVLIVALCSCSYTWGNRERKIPGGFDRVAVPVFKNTSIDAGAEVYFTNAFIFELERSRLAQIVPRESAEAIIEGKIVRLEAVQENPQSSDTNPNLPPGTTLAYGYRLYAKIEIRLKRIFDQKVLWASTFEGERPYFAANIGTAIVNSADATYTYSARYNNIAILAKDMMAEAHDRMLENF